MKQNIFLKFTSIFLCLQIIFSLCAPAIIYAQEIDPGQGGGSGATPTEEQSPEATDQPQPTETPQDSPAPSEEPAAPQSEAPVQVVEQAIDSAPPAQVVESSLPQETTLTSDAPVQTAGDASSNVQTQTVREEQQQAANASATTTQTEDTSGQYQQQAVASPIVDSTTQATVLTNYSQAANLVANATDAPTQTEREDSFGSPTLPTQLIAGLEQTNSQIPQVAGAVVSTVASVPEAAIGNIEGALEAREQQSLENRATQVEQEANATQGQQQRALDDYLNLSPQERAQQAAQILGLPPDTPPSLIVSQLDSIGQNSGVQLSGSLDNLTLTQDKSDEQKRFEENFPATLDSSLQTDQGLEQVNRNLDTLLGQTASFASAGLSDLVGRGVEALKGDLPRLQELRKNAGFDQTSRFDIQDIQKYKNLTQEELEQLKQGQIINGIVPEEARKVQAKYEYAKALKEWQTKNEELQQEAKISAALFYGGGLIAEGATTVAAKAAKPLLGRATEAVSGLFNRLFRGSATEVSEGGIQTALREGEPVFAQVLTTNSNDAFFAVGTRQNEGFPPLNTLAQQPPEIVERTEKLWSQTFGSFNPDARPETAEGQKQVLAEWLRYGKSEDDMKGAFNRAISALSDFYQHGHDISQVSPQTRDVINAWRYNSRLDYSFKNLADNNLIDVADSLLLKENSAAYINPLLKDATDGLIALRRYAVDNGADKASFTGILEATDPSNIHIVTQNKMLEMSQNRGASGLYNPVDKQLLILNGQNYRGVVTHECIHAACGITNVFDPGVTYTKLINELGSADNVNKLTEGLTEWATLKSNQLTGKADDFTAGYGQQVLAVEKIIQKMQEGGVVFDKGITRQEAEAKVIEASLSGYYGKLYEPLGKGNASKGREILISILNETPDTSTNVIPARLPLNVPEKVQIMTTKDKALVAAFAAVSLAAEGAVGKGFYDKIHPKKLPFNINLVKQIYAKSLETSSPTSPSKMFNDLSKIKLVENAINQSSRINGDFVKDVLETEIVDPSVIQTSKGYVFITGQKGTVDGFVEPGRYKVTTPDFKEARLSVPETIEVRSGKKVLEIGVGEDITSKKLRKNDKASFLNIDVHADDKKGTELSVVTFYDQNGNGKWDKDEKTVPWAGVQVELKKVNQDKLVKFNAGWNLFTLTAVPEKPLTASGLINEIAKQSGYATSVSTLVDGAWKTYVVRGDKDFSGDDFAVEPGKAYFVKNIKKSIFIFKGQELAAPIKVKLASGWNAVGMPKFSTSSNVKISDFVNGDMTAARWESGLWDSFVKQNAQEYGENFAIEPNRGYIIKVKAETELSP